MKSMEHVLLECFFNEPTKHWRFKELRASGLPDNKISRWLKRFVDEGIIEKMQPKSKLPYYVGKYDAVSYQTRKRLYMQQQLYDSGLLAHLASLPAKTVILFGSLARDDWHKHSDVDIFILGDDADFEQALYEKKLGREIQLFHCRDRRSLKRFNNQLLLNILKGDIIKGDIDFIEVRHAKE